MLHQREEVIEEPARAVLARKEDEIGDEVAGREVLGREVQRGGEEGEGLVVRGEEVEVSVVVFVLVEGGEGLWGGAGAGEGGCWGWARGEG